MDNLGSCLERLGKVAKQDKLIQFTNLMHHITPALLLVAFNKLNKRAARGVDGEGWEDFAKDSEQRLTILHERLQSGKYKPKPVKRQWLPKRKCEQRPIGITSLEDKIIQQALVQVLEPIYEADFLGFSYGFRPNRSQHQALDAVYMMVSFKKVSWVLDADLKGFFDSIVHTFLLGFIRRRIHDERVLKLINSWLTAGVMDGHTRRKSEVGTPQGAVISPLSAMLMMQFAIARASLKRSN
jgi:group II intron reverse transcriptase/maturase